MSTGDVVRRQRSGPKPSGEARRPGRMSRLALAPRLFLNNILIVVAGATTVLAAGILFGPPLFHLHLQRADLPDIDASVRQHVDNAFDQALLLSLGIGVVVASAVAAAISWLIARRVATPLQQTASALERLADGHHDVHVDDPGLGPELATLADSSNRLAHRLQTTDEHRRRLTADLAHQLRTPIASLQATAQALQDGILAPDEETLAVLTDQATHLQRLVADLEKVSRAEERRIVLTSSPQQVAPVVEHAVAAQRERYAAAGVTLGTDLPAPGPVARFDADRLREALGNLLDNALGHTPEGGRVTVSVRDGDAPRSTVIEVADTGRGFEPDHAEQLFHRFHRESADQGGSSGSGLGLTIARALVEAHGGTLTARSDGPGRGAEFTITLPAAANPPRPRSTPAR
jgi:two-component system sensor histidine kinase BaeS